MKEDRIIWIDPHHDREKSPEVVGAIWHLIDNYPSARIRVYVIPRTLPTEIMEWSGVITSPQGLRHVAIVQRRMGGAVSISNL